MRKRYSEVTGHDKTINRVFMDILHTSNVHQMMLPLDDQILLAAQLMQAD